MRQFYKLCFTSGTTTINECKRAFKGLFTKTDYISEYHQKLADFFGTEYVFSYTAARMALYSILKAACIGEGDEVIIQGYTCVVVPKAIIHTGARPVYVDINKNDFNMNIESLKKKISGRTKAIIVQHTYGNPCRDTFLIKKLCEDKGIILIEDSAHIIGGELEGKKLGTIGDATIISTDHTKYISTSVGGFALINNKTLGEKMQKEYLDCPALPYKFTIKIAFQLTIVNICSNKYFFKIGQRFLKYYASNLANVTLFMADYGNLNLPSKYPYPSRLSNVQAIVGIEQLKKLNYNIEHRIKITQIYKEKLQSLIKDLYVAEAPLRFPMLLSDRAEYIKALDAMLRVETWFDPVIVCMPENRLGELYYENTSCPVAEVVSKQIINLPVHMKITEKEAETLADIIIKTNSQLRKKG